MLPGQQWARNLTITKADVDYLTSLLLEQEVPLTTDELARALIDERLRQEAATIEERYQDAVLYSPASTYSPGQKLIFSALNFELGTVLDVRPGHNQDYGAFEVIAVQFENNDLNNIGKPREFAANLQTPHRLSQDGNGASIAASIHQINAADVLQAAGDEIVEKLDAALSESNDLIYLARRWFPYDLLMEANVGHRNLAEAVLDMMGGGPLPTEQIVQEIGGLGKAPMALQVYSLNYALNEDDRFDEVGPTGEVLWFLTRLEPPEVRQVPPLLRYTPIDYDRSQLTPDLLELEAEIADELTPGSAPAKRPEQATVSLIYPHRRLGTLPLNPAFEAIFPTARQTPRVWVTLVDGQDGEEYPAWVVRKERYVFGMAKFYRKHKLPVGVALTVRPAEQEGKILINFEAHRPRTEWIRLIVPKGDAISFENQKRAIGAGYDDLMILGADDLAGVDAVAQTVQQQKRSLVSLLKMLIPALGALTPQGTAHAKTLYSAVNILRRCPPGPLFATLLANPDFENVGGHYWKLRFD